MPSFRSSTPLLLATVILLICYARPTHAFGAGNIASFSKIEGQNWRHGDLEDTLLTLLMTSAQGGKKFSKLDVKRVYFGNWLRDYSQAVDVGTVKSVSAEAIRLMLWILGFLSFGFGTGEFEVTRERLGCYRPEEHIDNPKDYADNIDARQYDRRLRGPVDEERELSVDERTGMKNYIASEDLGIVTSAGLVRKLFRRSVDLARRSNRGGSKADMYEALRLLGTGCHCLEDFSAHSNYTELALIEMGERNVFPHVGRRTQIQLRGARGPVYPLVTGTFGGVDFLHSVMGELSDKATQSEIQELEGTMTASQSQENKSMVQDLLKQLPDGLFGGKDEASKVDELSANSAAAQMQGMHITPKEPEAFIEQVNEIAKQIYPIMEFHDEIMKSITETIDNIPILPDLLEQVQEQMNIFVFSLLAPYVLPIIRQVKTELATGSSEIIQSSREKQLIVFHDDHSTDPTHSMLSKDHFSNVLNEPAGKVAQQILRWAVPQLVECWDDPQIDADRTIDRIIDGVFHHPALRGDGNDGVSEGRVLLFGVVAQWWEEQSERARADLRDKLSREGVERGRNHKEGVHDKGHGCGKPLGMPGLGTALSSGAPGGRNTRPEQAAMHQVGKAAGEAVGGGALGGLVGGIVGGVGASLLGDALGGDADEKKTYKKEGYGRDGSHTQSYIETGRRGPGAEGREGYAQAGYKTTTYPGGGQREEYSRYEQDGPGGRGQGYGFTQAAETRYTASGGYERTEEKRYERNEEWRTEVKREGVDSRGEYYTETKRHSGKYGKKASDDDDDDDDDDYEKKQRKREKKERERREKEEKKMRKKQYGGGRSDDDDDDDDDEKKKRRSGGYGGGYGQESGHGRRSSRERKRSGSRERRRSKSRDRNEGGYGRQEQSSYGGGYEAKSSGYGRQEEPAYGGGYEERSSGYGRTEQPGYGGRQRGGDDTERSYGGGQEYGSGGYGREEQPGYGGGYQQREEGYGRREEPSEGMPGAFGGGDEEEYGERRRGYGQGGGYGGGY
ncbi:hypothetical protein W97_08719 [Coniosporium apollinis CBS 100218]|uniref:Het-C-domain-containing protein n=1 Tax=Coniosporium apollinis (strain CBS 100218) TaxID=1168221 RepID=R7Z604_CONA1|nr:uncharacterized protein W97_08719 [Coniosporium apollinis CBS 100218]EON69459.1 hypothetical protein W97_08719 [Coniosporium apollinis CBS 100218]